MDNEVKYNYTYKLTYTPGVKFTYNRKNMLISYAGYKNPIKRQIPIVIEQLKKDISTRQAVIIVNHKNEEPNACLLNMQFQIYKTKMYVTVNFRSQCSYFGRPHDEQLIYSIIDEIKKEFKDIRNVDICVHVANYHRRNDIIEEIEKRAAR